MALNDQKPHFVLLPFLAQGHTIPMVDIARLLAKRGVTVTILTTPYNANRFKTVISRAVDSGLDIRVFHFKLPVAEVGLPEECQTFDMLRGMDDALKLFKAVSLLENQFEESMADLKPSPNCLVADMCFPFATAVAGRLKIPRIVFHGTSCFSLLCMHIIGISKDFEDMASDYEYFILPGMPDRIEITRAQVRGTVMQRTPDWAKIADQIIQSDVTAFGTIANTFQDLEPAYIEEYKRVKGTKAWCVGPVSLCNKDDMDKYQRGNKPSIDEIQCLKWLGSQETGSVLYVCLGSLSRLSASQLMELGIALETSGRPFIWVIREASDEFKKWLLEEKFEERNKSRGLLIHGWAPQVFILSHLSVGGFLTHCGWNSTIEGITAGVPLITWPVFGEQFCNEKLIVNVIKTGIRVGVEVPIPYGDEEKMGVLVKNDQIKMAIDNLMDGGEEGEERRDRAQKLMEKAKKTVEEGGSSYLNMTSFINDVMMQQVNGEHEHDLTSENDNSEKIE